MENNSTKNQQNEQLSLYLTTQIIVYMFEDDNCLSTSQLKSLFNMFVDGNWYIVMHYISIFQRINNLNKLVINA
jgi:hypothetical protein